MVIKYFEPQSLEWLEARKKYVTATEVASIFGLDPYKSANKTYQGKLEEVEVIDNIYMRAGRFLEPAILADLYTYGIPAKPAHESKLLMVIDEQNKISCTLDGKAEWRGKKFVVECKTTSGMTKDKSQTKFAAWSEQVPLN
jgi:predicted phage-related endonuclease